MHRPHNVLQALAAWTYERARRARRRPDRRVLAAVPGLLALWLALALIHEILVLAFAAFLSWLSSLPAVQHLATLGPLDDVHGPLALQMLGDLRGLKLAVTTPAG